MRSCTSAPTAVGIEQSSVVYIASANYPDRYPIDSDCQWRIVATQQAESLHGAMSLTIIDFELDVRRGGRCHDVFTVTASTSAAETRQRAGNSVSQCYSEEQQCSTNCSLALSVENKLERKP